MYARALRLSSSERNILTKRVRYEVGETVLSALVASESGWDDRYRTSVSVSADEQKIIDWACTCPAAYNYDGMCKHCAALALSYSQEPERFMGFQKKRKVATTSCLVDLMRRSEQLSLDDGLQGQVDIELTLSYGYRLWSASFRVGIAGASFYVIKNVTDFVHRMRQGESYSYGKKLSFTHSPALLTARARKIAEFLDRVVSYRSRTAVSRWGTGPSGDIGRELDLSEAEVVELLDILDDGTPFTVNGADIGQRRVSELVVVHEDPQISLAIVPVDTGGFTIERFGDPVIVGQGDRLYVWQDDLFYRCSPGFARTADFLRTVYTAPDAQLFVSEDDMPLFCAAVLPVIEGRLSVRVPSQLKAYRPVPGALSFYFDKTRAGVTLEAKVGYGEAAYVLAGEGVALVGTPLAQAKDPSGSQAPAPLRDSRLEARACSLVERYFGLGEPLISLSDEDAIGMLLFGGLAEFRALGEVFTTPAFDRLIRDGVPRISMGVSLSGNLIDLDVSAGDLPASELSALLGSYRKRKRYHKLKSGAFVSLEDFDLAQLDRIANDLGISARELASGHVELPAYRAFYLDEERDIDRDRSFDAYIDNFKAVDERSYALPPELAGVLRPYQEEGFRWLSARADAGFGGVLADEMGLGKSVQLISFLLARADEARRCGPSLIVCPASLVYNWLAEFERFAPSLKAIAVSGPARDRKNLRQRVFSGKEACDVLVTSYDLLRIDVSDYAGRGLYCCALDEAQYVKNPAALVTRAVKRVSAQHRFALTGTPMENRLSELWSIFDFLMPGLLGPYARFRERFELPIVGGEEDVARRLQALVGPFLLRRLKTQVLADLPEKLESVVFAPMQGEQLKLYQAHEQRLRQDLTLQKKDKRTSMGRKSGKSEAEYEKSKVQILAELTRLRQICCDPGLVYEDYHGPAAKLDTICELVSQAMEGDEKALVFSQFTSFLEIIAERLDSLGVPFYTITGATPKRERLELVNRFNADKTPVFLISLKAGGTGLNLTGASVVIHADPWWNAAAQNQATDRAHRIGQTRVVSVQRVIAKGTIEERIVRLQEAKTDLADQVVGASGVSLASLSREDLAQLLEG